MSILYQTAFAMYERLLSLLFQGIVGGNIFENIYPELLPYLDSDILCSFFRTK